MDIAEQQPATQPISDDQELAKALAGIADEPEPVAPAPVAAMSYETTPAAAAPIMPQPTVAPVVAPAPTNELATVKSDALQELRPLIDHVDLPAEEKFDIYLMLIRSTDDVSLIPPAHTAAQGIADEKRRAEALLDVIKEIDFLTHKTGQAAA